MALEQSYQTGNVSSFAGATGMLEALLALIVGTEVSDEVIATAANVSTSLANTPVGKGRIVVKYTISAVAYEATDDGVGAISGTNITAGTIDYDTGAIAITFSSTPTGNVTADYIYGNAGEDWRQEVYRNTTDNATPRQEPFGTDCKEVILSNTGISGQEQVYIGIREWQYPTANCYCWNLNAYTWYNDDMDFNANMIDHGYSAYNGTYESWYELPSIPFVDDTMTYWFFSNRQRIIVVAKISSQYEQMYLGFGRRFGNPSDYPFPIMVGGCITDTENYSYQGSAHRGIAHNTVTSAYNLKMIYATGNWLGYSGQEAQTCPYIEPRTSWINFGTISPTTAGRVLMYPCYVCQPQQFATYFDLDGVHCAIGTGIQAEDTIDRGEKRSLIFPNIYQTTYYDYVAIEYMDITTTTTTTTFTLSTTTTTTT